MGLQDYPVVLTSDRHLLFHSRSAHRGSYGFEPEVLPSASATRSRQTGARRTAQAILVLSSEARGGQSVASARAEAPQPSRTLDGQVKRPVRIDTDLRRCTWVDTESMMNEKLVEDLLGHAYGEYCRLFRQHSGGTRTDRAQHPCRASVNPSIEQMTSLLTSTRKLTKDSNAHIPLPMQYVHENLRSPCVYIFDCSHAGQLIRALDDIVPLEADVIALGACAASQTLPWDHAGLPSDLLTACLTSPIRTALNFYRVTHTGVVAEDILRVLPEVGGRVQDRNTPLGELQAIFVAITDAIAWSSFEPSVFTRLFREDGSVAELFRNHLLAQRILQTFNVSATSRPPLPETHTHSLWDVWDSAVELMLIRLESSLTPARRLDFFNEQLAAFATWLQFVPITATPDKKAPPVELPIVLQGLLHPHCRLQALHLLLAFVDLGAWAVELALHVGIRPYLGKLLLHEDANLNSEVSRLALLVWTKMLSFDTGNLPKTEIAKGFQTLANATRLDSHLRAFACFCLAVACHSSPDVLNQCVNNDVLSLVGRALETPARGEPTSSPVVAGDMTGSQLLKWMALVLCAELCRLSAEAATTALRRPLMKSLLVALKDPAPEVRASAVHALGCILKAVQTTPPMSSTVSAIEETECAKGRSSLLGMASGSRTQDSLDAASDAGSEATVRLTHPPVAYPALASSVMKMPPGSRWHCVLHAVLDHFCREGSGEPAAPLDLDGASMQAPPPLPECSILAEISPFVRYELVCLLAPWLVGSSAPSTTGLGGSVLTVPHFNPLPPADGDADLGLAPDEAEDVGSVCSTPSCPGTPTYHPLRSPHMRPNSSLSAVPVAAAHQPQRWLWHLLAQDPLLPSLGDSKQHVGGAQFRRLFPSGSRFTGREGIRRAASESSLFSLGQDVNTQSLDSGGGSSSSSLPESLVYKYTVCFMQQPGAVSRLRPSAGRKSSVRGIHRSTANAGQDPYCCSPSASSSSPPPCSGAHGGHSHCYGIGQHPGRPCLRRSAMIDFCEPCHTDCLCDMPLQQQHMVVRDLDVSLIMQSEDIRLSEIWDPCSMGTVCFHPSMPICLAKGRHGCASVINYDTSEEVASMRTFNIHHVERGKTASSGLQRRFEPDMHGSSADNLPDMTQMLLINEHFHNACEPHDQLLCCGTTNGTVHICKCWGCGNHEIDTICAFQAIPRRPNAALCMDWLQTRAHLVTAGRDPHIRLWDLAREELLVSFKRSGIHYVSCVAQYPSGTPANVCIGCGNGDLLLLDSRTPIGIVQQRISNLEAVATLSPGVYAESQASEGPLNSSALAFHSGIIASTDPYGMVDLWDVRVGKSLFSYQVGADSQNVNDCISTASYYTEKPSTLCTVLPYRGLIVSAQLSTPVVQQEITVSQLMDGKRQHALALEGVTAQICGIGYHPTRDVLGVLTRKDEKTSRLLIYKGDRLIAQN